MNDARFFRVIEELSKIAFADVTEAFEWDSFGIRIKPDADLNLFDIKITKNTARVKLRFDKMKALDLLWQCLSFIDTGMDNKKVIEINRDCVELLEVA